MKQKFGSPIDWATLIENRNAYYLGILASRKEKNSGMLPHAPKTGNAAERVFWRIGFNEGKTFVKPADKTSESTLAQELVVVAG